MIGRNEGDRLLRCLTSVLEQVSTVVYVDSGSTDNSVQNARALGIHVVELDMSVSFTAARARNAGAMYLLERFELLEFLQFIDGDCELSPGWMEGAVTFLDEREDYAIVCGRRSEIFPDKSIYNKLCDIEWDTPVGDADACGGDALVRVLSFNEVCGYSDGLIAGEEPEMCFRMRQNGWKIFRLDHPMTLHDAAMYTAHQWWQRSRRSGFAYMTGANLHGRSAERFWVRQVISIVLWAALIPISLLLAALVFPISLLGFLVYPFQLIRMAFKGPRSGLTNLQWALFTIAGKFPQFFGLVHFLVDKYSGRMSKIIEYK